jgi:hypothetical protein
VDKHDDRDDSCLRCCICDCLGGELPHSSLFLASRPDTPPPLASLRTSPGTWPSSSLLRSEDTEHPSVPPSAGPPTSSSVSCLNSTSAVKRTDRRPSLPQLPLSSPCLRTSELPLPLGSTLGCALLVYCLSRALCFCSFPPLQHGLVLTLSSCLMPQLLLPRDASSHSRGLLQAFPQGLRYQGVESDAGAEATTRYRPQGHGREGDQPELP